MTRRLLRTAAAVAALVAVLAAGRGVARSRTFQLFGDLVHRVETTEPLVALTFDDGPVDETVNDVLATLHAHGVHATFFVIGAELEAHPDAGRRLVSAGHELANHSYSHRRMVLVSPGFVRREIERTDALIRAAGQRGTIWFRPPYGVKLVGLPWYLHRNGRTSVTWDIEPESYREVASDEPAIVSHVLDRARRGSIILLHPWYKGGGATRLAVAGIVRGLRERGLQPVTVGELMRASRARGAPR